MKREREKERERKRGKERKKEREKERERESEKQTTIHKLNKSKIGFNHNLIYCLTIKPFDLPLHILS